MQLRATVKGSAEAFADLPSSNAVLAALQDLEVARLALDEAERISRVEWTRRLSSGFTSGNYATQDAEAAVADAKARFKAATEALAEARRELAPRLERHMVDKGPPIVAELKAALAEVDRLSTAIHETTERASRDGASISSTLLHARSARIGARHALTSLRF